MGKLNIAHHKSYHPYRRDNIERVRRDEEEAKLKEAQEEGRMMLADSEARIELLRDRAGLKDKTRKKKVDDEDSVAPITAGTSGQGTALPTTNGHINLFQDLEQSMVNSAIMLSKKTGPKESEKGVKLAPDEKDLRRWYSQKKDDTKQRDEEEDEEKRRREMLRKQKHDPLTAIEEQLSSRSSRSQSSSARRSSHSHPRLALSSSSSSDPSVHARVKRESSERERALALIRRKQKELQGNMTPSTVYGGDDTGYGDQYNRKEVEEAHRGRDRHWDRSWGDDRSGRHRRRDW